MKPKTRYTVQFFADSGNWANPQPEDVTHCQTKQDVNRAFERWIDTVSDYDKPQVCSALVWIGELETTQDIYPDFQLTVGPRSGIRWQTA